MHSWRKKAGLTAALCASVALHLVASAPASAFPFFSHNHQPKTQQPKPPDDEQTLKMVEAMAHQPELMNARYLRYVLGFASNESQNNPNAFIQHYVWNDPSCPTKIKYELIQRQSTPGKIFQSTFIANLPNLKTDLGDLQSKYGESPHKFFDQEANPNAEYIWAPDTKVQFKQPQNTFHITKSIITYSGDCLPPLSALTLSQAQNAFREQAFEHHRKQNWSKAIGPLQVQCAEHPNDTEAHLALAQAYQHNNNLNGAIQEYHIVLGQSPDSNTLQQCREGLQALKVVPPDGESAQPQPHKIDITHHGQFLREGDQVGQKQTAPQTQQSFLLQPLNPPPLSSLPPGADPQVGF